jgi:hypothetical protein
MSEKALKYGAIPKNEVESPWVRREIASGRLEYASGVAEGDPRRQTMPSDQPCPNCGKPVNLLVFSVEDAKEFYVVHPERSCKFELTVVDAEDGDPQAYTAHCDRCDVDSDAGTVAAAMRQSSDPLKLRCLFCGDVFELQRIPPKPQALTPMPTREFSEPRRSIDWGEVFMLGALASVAALLFMVLWPLPLVISGANACATRARVGQLTADLAKVRAGESEDVLGQVTQINQDIRGAQCYNAIPVLGWWVSDLWDELEPIEIPEKKTDG